MAAGATARRRALVTGGASGIGAAIVRRLAADGVAVVCADLAGRRGDAAGCRDRRHRRRSSMSATTTRVHAVVQQLGPFDILVNSAGVDQHAFFTETTPQDWRRLLAVNLESVFSTTHAVLPAMQAAGYGRIVNIASEAGRLGSRGGSVYAAAKGGVIAFTRSIARENGRKGITANVVAPGPIDTPMLRRAVAAGRRQADGRHDRRHAGRRLGSPTRWPPRSRSWPPKPRATSRAKCWASPAAWGAAHERQRNPAVEAVIARVQSVYGRWRRDTPVAQMRADWDALFSAAGRGFVRAGAGRRRAVRLDGRTGRARATRSSSTSMAAASRSARCSRTAN